MPATMLQAGQSGGANKACIAAQMGKFNRCTCCKDGKGPTPDLGSHFGKKLAAQRCFVAAERHGSADDDALRVDRMH